MLRDVCIGLFLLVSTLAVPALATDTASDLAQDDSNTVAPVTLDGEVLFRLRGTPALPAWYRAQEVRERLVALADNSAQDPAAITVETADNSVALVVNDKQLVVFYLPDAELEQVPLELLASASVRRVIHAVENYREMRNPDRLLRNTGILLGISLLAVLLYRGITALFGWLNRLVERRLKGQLEQIEQASHRVINSRQLWGWLGGILRGLRNLLLFLLVLVWLETALGLYPWTRPLAMDIFRLILDPLKEIAAGFIASLPDLAFLAVLAVVIRLFLRVVHTFFARVDRGWIRLETFDRDLALPTYRIVRVVVIVFGLVIAYPYIPGSDSEAFKGMSIFFGVILSIGSSSFIANIIAGYSLIYRRAFRDGDRIRVGDLEGEVVEMKTMNTRIRSLKNEDINIPNSMLLGSAVINYSNYQRDPGLILHTEVGIGYDVSWRQVEAMLLQAALRTQGLRTEPAPFVLQQSLGDFAVVYQLNAYCDDARNMNRLYSALHGNIQDVFNEYGVQIMSPNYVADPEQAKLVPPEHWYAAPAQSPGD
ncbi:MAG: mechanosensitive ion channel [Halieaceae bacterium]|nr:mechanosensitive ion channel [Halieaceae bacterium]